MCMTAKSVFIACYIVISNTINLLLKEFWLLLAATYSCMRVILIETNFWPENRKPLNEFMYGYFWMNVRKWLYNRLLQKDQSYIRFDKNGPELEVAWVVGTVETDWLIYSILCHCMITYYNWYLPFSVCQLEPMSVAIHFSQIFRGSKMASSDSVNYRMKSTCRIGMGYVIIKEVWKYSIQRK